MKLTDKLTSACSVEFTVADYSNPTSTTPPVIIYAYTNGETTPNQQILINASTTSFTCLGTTINHTIIKGGVYKVEYTNSTLTVYENDVQIATASNNIGLPTRFEWHTGTNRYAVYKDLKVKPL